MLCVAVLGCERNSPAAADTTPAPEPTQIPTQAPAAIVPPTPAAIAAAPAPAPVTVIDSQADDADSPYLLFNQKWLEGQFTDELDINDVEAVFGHIFSRLPDEVIVYPSENYYYFILHVKQRQLWGNIRLPAGKREQGILSFAFFEFKESPYVAEPRAGRSKFFDQSDGVILEELDRFTWKVSYQGKDVIFNLNQLSQDPPRQFTLGSDEEFIQRTFDESGYQFFLIFNSARNFFLWVLNEEEPLPDQLEQVAPDLMMGRKSGFAFWVDSEHDNRKVLAAIRGTNATRNDYYDGPFDQLADNYVDEVKVSEYIIRASPSLEGRIDKFGYFTQRERPSRVSISPYYVYFDQAGLDLYMSRLRAMEDPRFLISRKGVFPTPVPSTTPTTN